MIIKRHMDQEMEDLRGFWVEMLRSVFTMLEKCLDNIGSSSQEIYDQIFDIEVEVNRHQMKIDDLAWKIMALYQPTATDLRSLIGAIKAAADLERVGDEVCAMCRRSMSLSKHQWKTQPPHLIELQIMVKSLFKDSLFALQNPQEELAEAIFAADDVVDDTFQSLFEWLRDALKTNPESVECFLDFLAMGRSLERIADHATNLAEIAIFIKKGRDVRHHCLSF